VERQLIKKAGASCYHIAGVQGRAWPSFPDSYRGAVPCCASTSVDNWDESDVVLRRVC
jgi:hypothetical protein